MLVINIFIFLKTDLVPIYKTDDIFDTEQNDDQTTYEMQVRLLFAKKKFSLKKIY